MIGILEMVRFAPVENFSWITTTPMFPPDGVVDEGDWVTDSLFSMTILTVLLGALAAVHEPATGRRCTCSGRPGPG